MLGGDRPRHGRGGGRLVSRGIELQQQQSRAEDARALNSLRRAGQGQDFVGNLRPGAVLDRDRFAGLFGGGKPLLELDRVADGDAEDDGLRVAGKFERTAGTALLRNRPAPVQAIRNFGQRPGANTVVPRGRALDHREGLRVVRPRAERHRPGKHGQRRQNGEQTRPICPPFWHRQAPLSRVSSRPRRRPRRLSWPEDWGPSRSCSLWSRRQHS